MGGQTSRMVRELVEDSLYIVRQTDRRAYERSVAAHQEVQHKLDELRQLNKETLQSAEQEAQRSEVFRSFQTSVSTQKQQLDGVVRLRPLSIYLSIYLVVALSDASMSQAEAFAKQFELPDGYKKIAVEGREERAKAEAAALAATIEAAKKTKDASSV
jgi:ATP-dependent protease HslVU (ClpYQ) ATPase subunit